MKKNKKKKKNKKNKFLVLNFSVILVLLFVVSCREKENEVTFILPDNEEKLYFLIKKDEAKELEIIKGKTTIKFDKTRFLYVKNFKPFETWHKVKAFEIDDSGNLTLLKDFRGMETVFFANLDLEVAVYLNSPNKDVYKNSFYLDFKEFLKLTDPARLEKMLSE